MTSDFTGTMRMRDVLRVTNVNKPGRQERLHTGEDSRVTAKGSVF